MQTPSTNLVLELCDAHICRGENIVFDKLNLQIQEGEFVYLTGAVGSGKSTLLRAIYAEIPVISGKASVLGYDLCRIKPKQWPRLRRALGIIFQDFQLLPDCTVGENLDVVLRAFGHKRQERSERITSVLQDVGLTNKAYKYPHELSGGEQQRVGIARAILATPRLIVADEPTANLDTESSMAIAQLLHKISQETGAAVLMATHNTNILERYPARQIHLGETESTSTSYLD